MLLKSSLVLIFLLIFSCQPVELIQPVEINNSEFELINEVFSTKNKSGLISYDSPFSLGANSTISLELKDDELYLFKKNCDEIVKSNNKIEFF